MTRLQLLGVIGTATAAATGALLLTSGGGDRRVHPPGWWCHDLDTRIAAPRGAGWEEQYALAADLQERWRQQAQYSHGGTIPAEDQHVPAYPSPPPAELLALTERLEAEAADVTQYARARQMRWELANRPDQRPVMEPWPVYAPQPEHGYPRATEAP